MWKKIVNANTRVVSGVTVCLALPFILLPANLSAAVKERVYPFGEADAGAAIGGLALMTSDIQDSATDSQGSLVPLVAFSDDEAPTYALGRDDQPGTFSLLFDGVDDALTSGAFDPRNFGGSFAALSQGWIKPLAQGQGTPQAIWSLGNDNGGVGISSDGFWELRASTIIPDTVTDVPVAFDEWTHIAILRGGGSSSMFVNGERKIRLEGFWNGPGDVTVGNSADGSSPFLGAIDDFNLAGFSDGVFNAGTDIDFFADLTLSGVLGDVDQNGVVDVSDYNIWSANSGFNNGQGAGDVTTLLRGDVDQNGRINYFDFNVIATQAAAAGMPLPNVPEPGTGTLMLVGMLWFVCGRRRRRA